MHKYRIFITTETQHATLAQHHGLRRLESDQGPLWVGLAMKLIPVLFFVPVAVALLARAVADTPAPPAPAPKLAPQTGDLSGYYSVPGKESNDKAYSGVATVERQGDVYVVAWTIGGNSFIGVGIRQSDSLVVGWAVDGKQPPPRGVNSYRISADGKTLTGRWVSIPGNGRISSETLKFLKPLEEEE